MKEIIKNIPMQFINGNLVSLWIGTILLIFLYYLTDKVNYFLSVFVFFITIIFATSLICRLIYITLIDSFGHALENVILNKFIDDKIVEMNMKVKVPKELITKQTKVK